MKKIIALLITVASFTTAFSQSRKIDEVRRVINGEATTVNERKVYSDRDYKYGTNKRKYGYKYKTSSGKRIGWSIGKGNPHRTGNWKKRN